VVSRRVIRALEQFSRPVVASREPRWAPQSVP
jgi:hypothetical protein